MKMWNDFEASLTRGPKQAAARQRMKNRSRYINRYLRRGAAQKRAAKGKR